MAITKELRDLIESYCSVYHVHRKTCTSICNTFGRFDINTIDDLQSASVQKIKMIRGIGDASLQIILALKGMSHNLPANFTFSISGSNKPKVTIEGNKLNVISCMYDWSESTETSEGTSNIIVSGYFDEDPAIVIFRLVFNSGLAIKI